MAQMDEETLLGVLQAYEEDSSSFVWGRLNAERETGLKEYFRLPYGNEQDGWSQIITSEVQDTIESILPEMLDIFTSTDKAVVFEPMKADDVQSAEQATDACNYVFYKQNNGFLNLYTAFKDALMLKNCALHWRKETQRVRSVEQVQGDEMTIALTMQQMGKGAEIQASTPHQVPMMDPMGQPVLDLLGQPQMQTIYDAKISRITEKRVIKVEAFQPENLLVARDWTSPLLDECPYVCRVLLVTLSELKEMGYDVTADELGSSPDSAMSTDTMFRDVRNGTGDEVFQQSAEINSEDESLTKGYLRIEYVLLDVDGDGIAERRCIYRLRDRILSNEECDAVQIATASPVLTPHRWDGMSMAELVSDLQRIKTDLTRAVMNNAEMAVNPRKTVLTDPNGAPYANVDDLLDSRPGGVIRYTRPDAVSFDVTPWVGDKMFPLLAYIDEMGEKRTGVSKMQQGIDPNALRTDRTAYEAGQLMSAAKMRVKLMARIFAEVLLKPTFLGIFKLLTEGDMEPLAFKLRGEFVQYDPNEWRDQYDMTVNVGLGTGDKQQQSALFQTLAQMQMGLAQTPFGQLMIDPKKIYNASAKFIESTGTLNVGDYINDPGNQPLPPPPPPPQLAIEQQKMQQNAQAEQMKLQYQAEKDRMDREMQAQIEMIRQQAQQQTDAARQAMEGQIAQLKLQNQYALETIKAQGDNERHARDIQFQMWKAELDAATKIKAADIASATNEQDVATEAATAEIGREVKP